MKNILILMACLLAEAASAQYNIDWHKIAGGGGASTNAQYALSGTAGQPEAGGPMAGGRYSLTGGFWALYAVQTPGAPLLTITRTATNTVVVSWPSPATGFVLQQTATLTPANWAAAPQTPVDDGTTVSVVVSPPAGNRFFRLRK
jgi:hypothetical protein